MSKLIKSLYGYCGITADCIHIGHINLLEKCKRRCTHLIVGVMSDEYIKKAKKRKPLMNYKQRSRLVSSIRFVDEVIMQKCFEYPKRILDMKKEYEGDMLIIDNKDHSREGADVLIPYTLGISSTKFRKEYTL